MKICKTCNIEYIDTMKFCPECGAKLEIQPYICPSCGTEYKEGQKFCSECGAKLGDTAHSKGDKILSSEQVEELYRKGEEYYDKADCDVENTEEEENFVKAFELFLKAANAGHAGAQSYLGEMYECGEGTIEDLEKSNKWYLKAFKSYEKSAREGNADALIHLAECYRSGQGVKEDAGMAVEILTDAYNRGIYKVGAKLCNYYLYGWGVPVSDMRAFEILSNCAENGDPDSQYELGMWYDIPMGPLTENSSKAAEWYKRAASSGHADASCNLGRFYYYGEKGLKKDYFEAVKWFKKAVDLGDAGYPCFYLGECYFKGEGVEKDKDTAYVYYLKAAEHGIADAVFKTANHYYDAANYEKAFVWYTKLVKADSKYKKTAQNKLDKFYDKEGNYLSTSLSTIETESSHGGIEAKFKLAGYYFYQDKKKSAKLYQEIAETGNQEALDKLLQMYTRYNIQIYDDTVREDNYGFFVDTRFGYKTISDIIIDYGEAMKWFRMAADQGNAEAMFIIGEFYYYGWSVQKDKERAIYWYKKAHNAGYPKRKFLPKIVEIEIKLNKDNLRENTFYLIKDGTKAIQKGMLKTDSINYPINIIYLPSSVINIGEEAFGNIYYLQSIICESPKTIAVTSMKNMFRNCRCLSDISFLAEWDVSMVESMECMFYYTNIKDLTSLAKWNTSRVKSMDNAFAQTSIENLDSLENWNVSNVESMSNMFSLCSKLRDISALSNWRFAEERRKSILKWARSMFYCCERALDITPLYSWGLSKTEIYRDLIVHVGPYQNKTTTPVPSTSHTTETTSVEKLVSSTTKISENEAIDKCISNVFFIKSLGYDITYPDGSSRNIICGNGASDLPSWSGTGFLLANGRFITARHVVEVWAFPSSGEVFDENMLAFNAIANNGGKVVAKFEAISSNGTRLQFSSAQCFINRQNDEVHYTEKGVKLTIAKLDNTDYAYFNTGRSSGLPQNLDASTTLTRGDRLIVLGFPLGIGANSINDINPIFGSGIVAANGLQNGVILTTDTNYEQGNSGGPAFKANSNGELEVVGLVSAGAGRTMGFIVPIASIK